MRSRKQRQTSLPFPEWGGARKGAGRKPRGEMAGVSHGKRKAFPARHPLHVSIKVVSGLPSLRSRKLFRVVRSAIWIGAERPGVRICEYSVLSNHLHLVIEANGKECLARGMQGLAIRIAKAMNKVLTRQGRVFADRYFARALATPLEVKRALQYVLENARKHGASLLDIDPFSSGPWFDGMSPLVDDPADIQGRSPLPCARTWLLSLGWKRHGPIELGVTFARS